MFGDVFNNDNDSALNPNKLDSINMNEQSNSITEAFLLEHRSAMAHLAANNQQSSPMSLLQPWSTSSDLPTVQSNNSSTEATDFVSDSISRLHQQYMLLSRRLMICDSISMANSVLTNDPINFGTSNNQFQIELPQSLMQPVQRPMEEIPAPQTATAAAATTTETELNANVMPDFNDKPLKNLAFPLKMYKILEDADTDGFQDVISFLPSGKGFMVWRPERFVKEVMPTYFKTCRLSSFYRQLNLYGFKRTASGADYGAYYNEAFIRGQPGQLWRLKRKKQRTPAGNSNPFDDREAILKAMPLLGADATNSLLREQL